MANLKQFKIGDTVQIGNKDIVKPLGTYSMYKVHTFLTGDITLAVRHELIKGMPDFRNFLPDVETPTTNNPVQTATKRKLYVYHDEHQLPNKRFASVNLSPFEYRETQKNKNTENRTRSHMKLIQDFLVQKG
ncbi:hypothetical protein MAR_005733 [Mya arenaria]|uniref:Uncharacterized protein n=1 Tax=Mya arenaria TaxID=6604 RepID=A0ABY7F0C3_MYAAR|nr:hypothetical protein MAR_005733 [Mya arenaria]